MKFNHLEHSYHKPMRLSRHVGWDINVRVIALCVLAFGPPCIIALCMIAGR